MIFLPDVNIWIAITSNRHVHHTLAVEWLLSVGEEKLAFCRLSELGFLRLLTNSHVMGSDVLSPGRAWAIYDQWRSDDRVIFLMEDADFSRRWRSSADQIASGQNAWTDAYLAIFAAHAQATVVTLDRKFPSLGGVPIRWIG